MKNKKKIFWSLIFLLLTGINISLGILYYQSTCREKETLKKISNEDSLRNENDLLRESYLVYTIARQSIFKTLPMDSDEIIFLGNSLTRNFEVTEMFHDLHVKNRGINGEVTAATLHRLATITASKPAKIFIEIGVNDLLYGVEMDSIRVRYARIVAEIQNESPATIIYIQSVLPTARLMMMSEAKQVDKVKELNGFLENLADGKKVKYINLHDSFANGMSLDKKYDCGDQLHLNGEGYLLWKKLIENYVKE